MKINKLTSILMSVAILIGSATMPAYAENKLTAKHFPTGVVVKDKKLYWIKPAEAGLKSTRLYKLENDNWTGGAEVTCPASIDDENSVYKIVSSFEGLSSEYIIQKNASASSANAEFGYCWGSSPFYAGVVADCDKAGNHALLLNSYTTANNGKWVEFASSETLIPNDLKTTGKKYQVDFDYKSTTGFCMWINGKQQWEQGNIADTWTHYSKVVDWNDSKKKNTEELSFDLGWLLNVQVDNFELHLLDSSGNKTGDNLISFDGTFETGYTNGLSNVKATPTVDGSIISWKKSADTVATRVYDPDGLLIGELGAATFLSIDDLEEGEVRTYKLASVYAGGYEAEPVSCEVKFEEVEEQPYSPKGVVVINNKVYWLSNDAVGLKDTKLYKLSNGIWEGGKSVTSPAEIDDENAVYKLEFVFTGYSTEYTFQKNDSANAPSMKNQPYGYVWGSKPTYMGVVKEDNNHSLFVNCYESGDNGKWLEFAKNGELIPNDLETTGKKYQVDFDYKSSYNFCLWINGKQLWDAGSVTDTWTHFSQVVDWNDVKNQATEELSLDMGWRTNIQIDNLELHLLDADGKVTGDNLISFDGTFEDSGEDLICDISDVKSTPTIGGAIISWKSDNAALATRVYNDEGYLIAELAGENSFTVNNLDVGKSKTFKLVSVYSGGYESEAKEVVATSKWQEYTIKEFALKNANSESVSSLQAGNYTASLKLKGNDTAATSAELIVAVYTNNELVKLSGSGKQTISSKAITVPIMLTTDMFNTGNDTKVCMFVFDGLDTRKVIDDMVIYQSAKITD